jgi:UDP-glucuronate 4-epimerase
VTSEAINRVLLTGAAGFIGAHVAHALLERGVEVAGVDNVNEYYSPALKRARLEKLATRRGFSFYEIDVADFDALSTRLSSFAADRIIHLAAQAGVRHSLSHPFAYARSNVVGHLSLLEFARRAPNAPLLVYASSSSVYGANANRPFRETDRVDSPVSLYAATKRADELMSESYARLYGLRQIGLRFFTVYGPWGRPDMAYWMFCENIMNEKPITLYNNGDLERDFTFIDDIVEGVLAVTLQAAARPSDTLHRIYNIGNNRPERLMRLVETLQSAIGKKAVVNYAPMQPGDVRSTCADISAIGADYGFKPTTDLDAGIDKFVAWYRGWRSDPRSIR